MGSIFPALPNGLQQFLDKPPAISTSEITSEFRAMGSQFPNQLAEMGERFQQYLDSLNATDIATLRFLSSVSLPNVASSSVLVVILSAGHTITVTTAPPNEGDSLTVFVKVAGPTGVLAWDSSVFKFASTELDSTSLTWTVFNFKGTSLTGTFASPLWCMNTLPLTGLT